MPGTPYDAMFDDLRRGVDPEVAAEIGHPVPEHLLTRQTSPETTGETAIAGTKPEIPANVQALIDEHRTRHPDGRPDPVRNPTKTYMKDVKEF